MFAFLKRPRTDVLPLFEAALAASRQPRLYRDFGVPDTLDGRFDALLLHLWPLFRALEQDDRAAQRLFDLTFKRMELALRETGSGDLAVGRQARAMMKAFYGRLVTYTDCKSDEDFRRALGRNLYGTIPDAQIPAAMVVYAKALSVMTPALDDVQAGHIIYPAL